MTDLIVRQETEIQQIETQDKADQILALIRAPADDGLFSGVVDPERIDWFTRTELYRLGLRRKGGNE